jgi:phenylacetate-CoA ligase
MPLVRYEVGDLMEVEEPDPGCPCGRLMPRVRRIIGRQEDVIVDPDGRVITTLFIAFDQVSGVVQGQVIQEAVDRLHVRVVRGPGYREADLLGCLRRFVGPSMRVEFEYLSRDDLRRGAGGKFRAVVSRVRHRLPAGEPAGLVNQLARG